MPNDYYPEPDDAGDKSSTPPKGDQQEGDTEEGATALLPKSILGGKDFEPGEEVVLQIKHVYEDEVEVAYAPAKKEESEKPKSTMSSDEEFDMMDQSGGKPPMY